MEAQLQMGVSILHEQMESLRKQEKQQQELRATYQAYAHRRNFPIPVEIIEIALSYIRTYNRLKWEGGSTIYVDGLLPITVLSPSLSLPHYAETFSTKWTIEDISRQNIKQTVIDEASLSNCITLRLESCRNRSSDLRPLMNFPHRWKLREVGSHPFSMENFTNLFNSCLPRLEELDIYAGSVESSSIIPLLQSSYLKKVDLTFNVFPTFFNSGIMNDITNLSLTRVSQGQFASDSVFQKALYDLPHMLSHLTSLNKLSIWGLGSGCGHHDLNRLSSIESTSLRILDITGYSYDHAMPFLSLFTKCHINRIYLRGEYLDGVEEFFRDIQYIYIQVSLKAYTNMHAAGEIPTTDLDPSQNSVPRVLFEYKQNGALAFPRLEQIELHISSLWDITKDSAQRIQDDLNLTLCARADDTAVRPVGYVRIPRKIVTNPLIQEKLEQLVPSLVLFD